MMIERSATRRNILVSLFVMNMGRWRYICCVRDKRWSGIGRKTVLRGWGVLRRRERGLNIDCHCDRGTVMRLSNAVGIIIDLYTCRGADMICRLLNSLMIMLHNKKICC